MTKKIEDKIGTVVTTDRGISWKVLRELTNNNELKPKTRRFEIECQKCGSKREGTYGNIFTKPILVCFVCENKPYEEKSSIRVGSRLRKFDEGELERSITKDGKIDKRTNRPNKVEYIGRIYNCTYDTFLCIKELDRVISKNGKNLYRNFLVECTTCGTQKEALAASLLSSGVACPKCRTEKRYVRLDITTPIPNLERKIEIISEINEIWEQMKKMQKNGTLNDYLSKKFGEEIEIEESEPINNYEIDNIDEEIDWEKRIDDILDDE